VGREIESGHSAGWLFFYENKISMVGIPGVPHVLFFLPSYVHSLHVGIDPATLLAFISAFDLIGRVVIGFLVDTNFVPKFVMYARCRLYETVSAAIYDTNLNMNALKCCKNLKYMLF
jgi:hypothetical protein